MPVRTCKTQKLRVEKTKDNEGMNKTRMEGEGKQREAEDIGKTADSDACQKVPNRK
jgi:hypothetical protein